MTKNLVMEVAVKARSVIVGKLLAVPQVAVFMLLTTACFTIVTDEKPQVEESRGPVYKIPGPVTSSFSQHQTQAFALILDGIQVSSDTIAVAHGTVEVSPPPDEISNLYARGTTVTLAATPDVGYALSEWSGDCIAAGYVCTVYMDTNKSVSVTFHLISFSTMN